MDKRTQWTGCEPQQNLDQYNIKPRTQNVQYKTTQVSRTKENIKSGEII